jgi:hypothetical protein
MLNVRGVDLFWPSPVRVVMPGRIGYRMEVGSKAEMVLSHLRCAVFIWLRSPQLNVFSGENQRRYLRRRESI